MISFPRKIPIEFCGFPPLPQKGAARMGHPAFVGQFATQTDSSVNPSSVASENAVA
jgi:hypothetical protein